MSTTTQTNNSRRNFLKLAALSSGGLFLGFNWIGSVEAAPALLNEAAAGAIDFNSYLSIAAEGLITIYSPNPEIGQNIKTSFPMIVAEELDADWTKIKTVQAVLDNKKYERQVTGGSGAVPHSWKRLRQAGATARQMLKEAAAAQWKVPVSELTTDKSVVMHKASGRKANYGELAAAASKLPVPTEVQLKDRKDFKLIGEP